MTTKKYFGTDGIRGRVGSKLINAEFMLKLGFAAGKVLSRNSKAAVIIGKDTRVSNYMLESALQAGFSAAGVDVQLLGPMPTPAVAHLAHSMRAAAGVVISASHNLYPDNGVKFFDNQGFKLSDELEIEIEKQIDEPMITVSADKLGKAIRLLDARGRYIEFCKNTFPDNVNLNGLKIVVDCANGATYHIAPVVFHELGATVIAVAHHPNGYNINDKCGATDLTLLKSKVKECDADMGIAFDGDGDRVMMVDKNAEVVDGDELLCILALGQHERPRGIVGTVMSNFGLEQTLKQNQIEFVRSKVGDRHVLAELLEKKWSLGGEASGHIVDLHRTTTGDGIITALQVLSVLKRKDKTLEELKQQMHKMPQVLINIHADHPEVVMQQAEIVKAIKEAEKNLADRGRILLRASGTEPLVRVMVEGCDASEVQSVAEGLAKVVQQAQ